jgi:hypothetical protein
MAPVLGAPNSSHVDQCHLDIALLINEVVPTSHQYMHITIEYDDGVPYSLAAEQEGSPASSQKPAVTGPNATHQLQAPPPQATDTHCKDPVVHTEQDDGLAHHVNKGLTGKAAWGQGNNGRDHHRQVWTTPTYKLTSKCATQITHSSTIPPNRRPGRIPTEAQEYLHPSCLQPSSSLPPWPRNEDCPHPIHGKPRLQAPLYPQPNMSH